MPSKEAALAPLNTVRKIPLTRFQEPFIPPPPPYPEAFRQEAASIVAKQRAGVPDDFDPSNEWQWGRKKSRETTNNPEAEYASMTTGEIVQRLLQK